MSRPLLPAYDEGRSAALQPTHQPPQRSHARKAHGHGQSKASRWPGGCHHACTNTGFAAPLGVPSLRALTLVVRPDTFGNGAFVRRVTWKSPASKKTGPIQTNVLSTSCGSSSGRRHCKNCRSDPGCTRHPSESECDRWCASPLRHSPSCFQGGPAGCRRHFLHWLRRRSNRSRAPTAAQDRRTVRLLLEMPRTA